MMICNYGICNYFLLYMHYFLFYYLKLNLFELIKFLFQYIFYFNLDKCTLNKLTFSGS